MKTVSVKAAKYILIVCLSLVIFGWASVEFWEDETFFHGYQIEKPIIKIGLGVNLSLIQIQSSSGMKIYEVNPNYRLVAEDVADAQIKGSREKLTEKFLIQIAQTGDREDAEMLAKELRTEVDGKVSVTENVEGEISGIFQIKVGDFLTRGDALSFIKKLNQMGFKETWIIQEDVTEEESRPLWILVNDELKSLSDDTVLYFIPSQLQSYLSYKGRAYRGIFVLRATHKGIVLINILNLEDYLKSVVPSELSPHTYNELEAHKAQAVAARTYAIRNLGKYKDLGFNLDDSPRSQYYKGMRAEHPLSSEAVELTRGEVARYKGRLIDALYTSTCGGMTENVENVFVEGPTLPYLRSQECVYENQDEWLLKSGNAIQPVFMNGKNISSEVAYLVSLGVISGEEDPRFFEQTATFDDAVSWIKNAVSVMGKKNDEFHPAPSPLNFLALARLIADGFGWRSRVENLMAESETDFIMRDIEGLSGEERDVMAYLVQSGILPLAKDLTDPERVLTRAELAFFVARVMKSYPDFGTEGIFKGLQGNTIELRLEKKTQQFVLSPDFFLFKNNGGGLVLTSHVYLLGGEKLRFFEKDGEVRQVEIQRPAHTNILDRRSIFHRWQKRITRNALERRINRFYPVGELVDVVPQKRGASKRAVEVLITGKETQVIVKGLRIRRVLGLNETLFVIEREYDKDGSITHFTFFGKGLGHGVGLCQVGAFGMALAGADYKQILKKYYHGIKITKSY
ncbi:MAG: SpoIID/LytB domain-containing protein [Candidatus Aminicenantes bacterium]|nr:SpoIID/LytB domain-containing protein [Candidatus Aminicenantes bacterium]